MEKIHVSNFEHFNDVGLQALEINGNLYFTEHLHNEISQTFVHIKKQINSSNYRQT